MSHAVWRVRKSSLRSVMKILENDIELYPDVDIFSRNPNGDEGIEISMMRNDKTKTVQIFIEGLNVIDAEYTTYEGLRNIILCDRAVEHEFRRRAVVI
jgi:hypothetical protein